MRGRSPAMKKNRTKKSSSRASTPLMGIRKCPFFLAPGMPGSPGGAIFLLCLLSRWHCGSTYLLSKTREVIFWVCLSVCSPPFSCLSARSAEKTALVAQQVASFCKGTGCLAVHLGLFFLGIFEQQISACLNQLVLLCTHTHTAPASPDRPATTRTALPLPVQTPLLAPPPHIPLPTTDPVLPALPRQPLS
jgi:hypothetical protein